MKIEIVPYNPAWPAEVREIGKQIRDAVGNAALTIHHIGSISVPGLSAKDIIDVQLGAADFSLAWKERLEAIGFEYPELRREGEYFRDHCPPGTELSPEQLDKQFFKMKSRAANLHIRVPGRFNYRYALLFRDYLRAHSMAANAYGAVKKNLARYSPKMSMLIPSSKTWSRLHHGRRVRVGSLHRLEAWTVRRLASLRR